MMMAIAASSYLGGTARSLDFARAVIGFLPDQTPGRETQDLR